MAPDADSLCAGQHRGAMDIKFPDVPMPLGNYIYDMGGHDDYAFSGLGAYPDISGLSPPDLDVDHLDWSAVDWDLGNAPTGETGASNSQGNHVTKFSTLTA